MNLLWTLLLLVGAVAGAATRRSNIDAMCPRMVHQVFENYVPFGNLSAGNYTHAPADRRLWPCVLSCCTQLAQCNVAFMVADKCYHVQCVSNELCMPHRHEAPANGSTTAAAAGGDSKETGGDSELRMVLVHPVDGDLTWLDSLKRSGLFASGGPLDAATAAARYDDETADGDLLYGDAPEQRPQPLAANGIDDDDDDGRLSGIYRGFTNAAAALSQFDGDLQMDDSQPMPYAVTTCLLQLAVPDDRSSAPDDQPPAIACAVHEVCVQLERGSPRGVCACAAGFYRSKLGPCESELRSDQQLPVDLQPAPPAQTPTAAAASSATTTTQPPPQTTAPPSSANRPLTVSVLSKDVRLPEREVSLAAYTISDDIGSGAAGAGGTAYHYLWSLISQPGGDVNGTMSDHTKDTIRLTNLSEGQYRFKVLVTGGNRTGEAYANVTVSPQKRINRAPQVQITPADQTVKLPTSQAILDGSTSTDDDRIAVWHWDLIQGPIGYRPQLPEISTLQLADLRSPGNYTFRLTLTDSDGASNSSEATVRVLKANDYPPEANAGSDVILYLPENHVTLNGSLSTDDREITRWQWTKDASVVSRAVDMQNTSTPFVELSNLQEGIYAFKLEVSDASNQTSTARVHVFVKQPPENRAPHVLAVPAGADGNVTVVLPQTWAQLNGSAATAAGGGGGGDVAVVRFEWRQVSGPPGVQWTDADRAVANASRLTVGVYVFRLTGWSEGGLNGTADVWVRVRQEQNTPPVANAGGDQSVYMPVSRIIFNGSQSSDDLGIVFWSWTREESSLAVGSVMAGDEAVMTLNNVVPGRYVFVLLVTDAQGATSTDTASVIVHPDPMERNNLELTLAIEATHWRQSEADSLLQRLLLLFDDGCMLHMSEMRPDVRRGEVRLAFYVSQLASKAGPQNRGGGGSTSAQMVALDGHRMERLLAQRFRREPDILGAPVLDVRTAVCQNACSGHGVCEADTRACACDAFWMPDVFWFGGMAEANCNWSILYVVIGVLVIFLCFSTCCWGLMRLCRRGGGGGSGGHGGGVKKSLQRKRLKLQKYSPLGTKDDGIPTLTQSAATLSETDTDSDIVFESSGRNGSKSSLVGGLQRKQHDIEAGSMRGSGGGGSSSGGSKSRTSMTRLGRRLRT